MSKRLTHKRCNGIAAGYWSLAKRQEMVDRLARFEDLADLPRQICNHYCRFPYSCNAKELEAKCWSCPLERLAVLLE